MTELLQHINSGHSQIIGNFWGCRRGNLNDFSKDDKSKSIHTIYLSSILLSDEMISILRRWYPWLGCWNRSVETIQYLDVVMAYRRGDDIRWYSFNFSHPFNSSPLTASSSPNSTFNWLHALNTNSSLLYFQTRNPFHFSRVIPLWVSLHCQSSGLTLLPPIT